MLSRIVFILITLFWLTMNVLLWREEFGSHPDIGSAVPVELVWQKILTAPDSSSLVVVHHGKRIGLCHWITGISKEWATVGEENVPAGMPRKVRGYELRLEGSAVTATLTNRVRFEGHLELAQNRQWRTLDARLALRPLAWKIHASAAEQTLQWTAEADGERFERVFKFSELQNPAALLRGIAGPLADELLAELDAPAPASPFAPSPAVRWEAYEDHWRVGRTEMPVYRLQTRLLDRYLVRLLVSRVGEILQVELPNDLVLTNDQLTRSRPGA